jgi:O-acetyl-ADP-ribose deacetylase (regulator of RNase III)
VDIGLHLKAGKIVAKLIYTNGDVTNPKGMGNKIIIQLCNNIGVMGAGVALCIANKYPMVKKNYINLYRSTGLKLGFSQFVQTNNLEIIIANLIAQKGINDGRYGYKGDLVDYESLKKCLNTVFCFAKESNSTIHAPKIGSGLAGGSWDKVEAMLIDCVKEYGVDCTVYIFGN